ncbi:Hypothetical protein A7982_01630 [Minicystis rosea]|nr:Hypothetical protein A7982_01630 [Minicystis rosea]
MLHAAILAHCALVEILGRACSLRAARSSRGSASKARWRERG